MTSVKCLGILTYHNADNLGAVLQAYALQRVLEQDSDISAEIIDYRCAAIEATKYVRKDGRAASGIRTLPRAVYYWIKRRGFQKFRRKYLKCSGQMYDLKTIASSNHVYDAFITGSDQVWNPKCSGCDDTYLLDFVSDGRKKYSYAASIGSYRFHEHTANRCRDMLKSFDGISVREASAREELSRIGIENVQICPDPVLLLTEEDWKAIMPGRLCKQKYVLVYQILPDSRITKMAEAYAKKHHCKVIHNKKSLEFILHNSPAYFLSWIYYADCVFTNSFHGTAFSLLFEKPLCADVKMADGRVNDRVQELLEAAGAEKCALCDNQADVFAAHSKAALSDMRKNGQQYLRKLCGEI